MCRKFPSPTLQVFNVVTGIYKVASNHEFEVERDPADRKTRIKDRPD